jgi:hypothetical protein
MYCTVIATVMVGGSSLVQYFFNGSVANGNVGFVLPMTINTSLATWPGVPSYQYSIACGVPRLNIGLAGVVGVIPSN